MKIKELFNQPKAVFLLAFVQLWNRFSYYGMRTLLVLFMLHVLKFDVAFALGIYAVFCALSELGGVFGSYLADKVLGLRRSIILGGWIIAFGHISLAMGLFFPGLALLIVGSSLFSTNSTALIGNFYSLKDDRRTNGFFLFYMAINIGAVIATFLCGFLAETYGWEYGFGIAAAGMLLANVVLYKYRRLLDGQGEPPLFVTKFKKIAILPLLIGAGGVSLLALIGQSYALPLLPFIAIGLGYVLLRDLWKKKYNLASLGISLGALVLFFAAEEQFGSSMMVFADKMMTHTVFGMHISTPSILAINPIVIILFGTIATWVYASIRYPFLRTLLPFLLTASAFAVLVIAHILIPQTPLVIMMGVVAMISFAELLVGPLAYSTCSKMASEAQDPKVMGLVPIGFSLAATIGGGMSKAIASSGYDLGFLLLAITLALGGGVMGLLHSRSELKEAA